MDPAITALLAEDYANEAMILQLQANDQWSYYGSKALKENSVSTKIDLLEAMGKPVDTKDTAKLAKYARDKEEIQAEALTQDLEGFARFLRHCAATAVKLPPRQT